MVAICRSLCGMRRSFQGLPRYIVSDQVANRVFQWLDASMLPHQLIAVATADALHLGVLSSAVHVAWALASGGLLADRPVHSKSKCFDAFPFSDISPAGALAYHIRRLLPSRTVQKRMGSQ